MDKLQKDGPEEIVYKWKIFEVVKQPMKVGEKRIFFEIARRSPGVRLIIIKDDKMLITREFRSEINCYDYRLPGGKVFDTLDEYNEHLSADLLPFAIDAAKKECKEEVGIKENIGCIRSLLFFFLQLSISFILSNKYFLTIL